MLEGSLGQLFKFLRRAGPRIDMLGKVWAAGDAQRYTAPVLSVGTSIQNHAAVPSSHPFCLEASAPTEALVMDACMPPLLSSSTRLSSRHKEQQRQIEISVAQPTQLRPGSR